MKRILAIALFLAGLIFSLPSQAQTVTSGTTLNGTATPNTYVLPTITLGATVQPAGTTPMTIILQNVEPAPTPAVTISSGTTITWVDSTGKTNTLVTPVTISVPSVGNQPLTNVTVTVPLAGTHWTPTGTTFPAGVSYVSATNMITFTVPTLAAGASASTTVTGIYNAMGTT